MFYNTTDEDYTRISAIADRAIGLAHALGVKMPKLNIIMDIAAVHSHAYTLDLDSLLKAADMDLAHDVWGIAQHLDRRTGLLLDCFVPRFAITTVVK